MDTNEAPKHSPKHNIHQKKLMVNVWWSAAGEFMKPGSSVTADVYCNKLEDMIGKLKDKHLRLANRSTPILLHDNVKPHNALKT